MNLKTASAALCAASFLTLYACSGGTHDTGGGGGGGSTGGGTGGGVATGGGSAGGTGGGSAGGTGGGAMGGGSGGGGVDAGQVNPCGAGAHPTDAGCASTFDGWIDAGDLLEGRDHHVTFTATIGDAGMLFIAGGFNSFGALSEVESAPIGPDGQLGAFSYVADLPNPLGGQGCAQTGPNTVVLAGGLANTNKSVGDSTVGQIDSTGTITFTSGPPMNVKRYHVSVSFHDGYLYAIGGLVQSGSSQTVSKAIERAPFDGTTIGAWQALPNLPMALTHQAAVVDGDALYLLGGVTSASALTQIIRADFDADGGLSTFVQVGTLPMPRATSAGFYKNGYLYLVAGSDTAGNTPTATFERALVDGDGGVSTWEPLMDLPMARQHSHQTPWFNGYIYSAAGSDSSDTGETAVFAGKFE